MIFYLEFSKDSIKIHKGVKTQLGQMTKYQTNFLNSFFLHISQYVNVENITLRIVTKL